MKNNRFPQFPHQQGYPGAWRGKFARLTPIESDLMRWYLAQHAEDILEVWYDVRADGDPATIETDDLSHLTNDPAIRRMWQQQTAKRLDAITLEREGYRVVELRQRAAQETVGEVTTYNQISRAEWPDLAWLNPRIVTLQVDPIIRRTLEAIGFDVVIAPPQSVFRPTPLAPKRG